MKTGSYALLSALLALGVGGCCGGSIKAASIEDLVEKVSKRHDSLLDRTPDVNGDGIVNEVDVADKATLKRSSELLRRVVSEAKGK